MPGEASDDDTGVDDPSPRPPPDPLDRCWLHPTELAAAHGTRHLAKGTKRPAGWPTALAGGLAGALLTVGALAAAGVLDTGTETARPAEAVTPAGASASGSDDPEGSSGAPDLDAIDRVGESVVAVSVGGDGTVRSGSGVCVRHGGEILTSGALVAGGGAVTVSGPGGESFRATVTGRDAASGLALLTVEGGLMAAPLSYEALAIGEKVMVVGAETSGSPWVSAGIVASVDAPAPREAGNPTIHGLIETDAHAGDSAMGGALVDVSGAVTGIVVAAPGDRPGGLAVPVEAAIAVADALRDAALTGS